MISKRYTRNRWADSLSMEQWKQIFPSASNEELPYIWNRLTLEEQAKIFEKWKKIFKDKAVIAVSYLFR